MCGCSPPTLEAMFSNGKQSVARSLLLAVMLVSVIGVPMMGSVAAASDSSVTIDSPSDGATVNEGETVELNSTVSNASDVEWYVNGSLIDNGTDITHTFSSEGDYSVTAKALNSSGSVVATDSINLTVAHHLNETTIVTVDDPSNASSIYVEAQSGTLTIDVEQYNNTSGAYEAYESKTYMFNDSLELTKINISGETAENYSVHLTGNASNVTVGYFTSDGDQVVSGGSGGDSTFGDVDLSNPVVLLGVVLIGGGVVLVLLRDE